MIQAISQTLWLMNGDPPVKSCSQEILHFSGRFRLGWEDQICVLA